MKTWNELQAQAHRIMIGAPTEQKPKGYVYYVIGGKRYKRSDLLQLAAMVAQKRYGISRFAMREKTIEDYLSEWGVNNNQ